MSMPVSVRSLICGAAAAALVACGGDGSTPPPASVLTTINVSVSAPSIAVGTTATATASGLDQKGSPIGTGVVSWSTSNSAVASVSSAGVVSGVSAGTATISATSGGKTGSAAITVTPPAQPLPPCITTLGLALGETRTLTAAEAASVCISGVTGAREYVLMPFNSASTAATITPFQIEAANTVAVATVPSLGVIDAGRLSLIQSVAPDGYSIEAQFRARELQDIGSLRARRRVSRTRLGARATRIPATLPVGAIVQLNANLTGNTCTAARVNHPARVVASFEHAAVLIDTLSPAGGFTDAELTTFGAMFDTLAYAIDTSYFGKETDIDENGKIVILFTPGINSIPSPPGSFVGGLFSGRDLFPATVGDGCEASNEGEMFYMPVPDPDSTINGNYKNKATLSRVAVGTLAHEFQHLINAGRRVYVNDATAFEQVWLNEALSHIAEEALYFRVARQPATTNVNVNDVRTSQATVDAFNAYEVQNFGRYRSYLAAPFSFSPFSLTDGLEMRGAAYTLLRYATDFKGGDERATFFALVNATTSGRTNFNAVFGDLTTSARDWAMANFLDDLNIPSPAKYQHPSWNYRSIFTGLGSATLPIATSQLVAGTPLSLQLAGGGAAYIRFRINTGTAAQILASASGQPVPANIDFILVRTQ